MCFISISDSVSLYTYFFNITHFPQNTIPTQAELHLYREVQKDLELGSSDFKSHSPLRRATKYCSFIFVSSFKKISKTLRQNILRYTVSWWDTKRETKYDFSRILGDWGEIRKSLNRFVASIT